MSETETERALYAQDADTPMGEADLFAKRILRDASTRTVGKNLYKWHGKYYHIVAGRVLERSVAERLADEYRRTGQGG